MPSRSRLTSRATEGELRRERPHSSLRSILAPAARVTHLQVAVDGRWERAERALVALPDPDDAIARLAAPVRPLGEYGVEAFANDDLGHLMFCGVRFENAARREAEDLLRGVWTVAQGGASLEAIADWLSARIGEGLFDTGCSSAEVGVVDAWRSCGAVRVFPAEQAQPSLDAPQTLLAAAKRIPAPAGSIVAAEFASATPLAHWVGVEIARVGVDAAVATRPPIHAAAAFLATLREA